MYICQKSSIFLIKKQHVPEISPDYSQRQQVVHNFKPDLSSLLINKIAFKGDPIFLQNM
jgi:hypothetical protein